MIISLHGAAESGPAVPALQSETLVAPTLLPPPDREQVYIAPAALLPQEMRALCSCAGLFYARVWDVLTTDEGTSYYLEVAALARYFDAGSSVARQHVRSIDLPAERFALFLEWDRHLAALPTCDVRDLVEEHARRVNVVIPQELAPEEPELEEEADLLPLPQLFVTRTAVRDALDEMQANEKGRRIVQTALLQAALETLSDQLERERLTWQEHHQVELLCQQIRAVQQWRRTRRTWQRVVAFSEAWDQGRRGWDIVIGVPRSLAA